MKNILPSYKLFILYVFIGGFISSCSTDADDIGPKTSNLEELAVENFIYRGMNEYYLYKADIPELANDFFASQADKNDFLDNFSSPEDLFYEGLVSSQDRFSWIVDDYIELENSFAGITRTSGMSYILSYYSEGSDDVFGIVRYIQPGTSAEAAGVKRGDIFSKINDQQLTVNNFSDLLASDSFTINIASIEENTIVDSGQTVDLTTAVYQANPIYIAKTLDLDGTKVGYLMYNSFTDEFDDQLNEAFGKFKADNISELVLDLRYNSGGDVRTATDLAAMITGQFPGEIFIKQEWNAEIQEYFEQHDPNGLIRKFNTTLTTGTAINSLMLDKVYVLTTGRSASASELIINGLDPYIDVVQVGDKTTGKFTASRTFYDSPNFQRQNASTKHTYAIQPIILKTKNKNGVSDYVNGLTPDFEFKENIRNYGVLGDPSEPLLNAALNLIQGNRVSVPDFQTYEFVGEDNMKNLNYQRMYIDKLPPVINQ